MKKPSFLCVLLVLMGSLPLSVSYGMFQDEQEEQDARDPRAVEASDLKSIQNPYPIKLISFDQPTEIDLKPNSAGVRETFQGIKFTYSFTGKDGQERICMLRNLQPTAADLGHLCKVFGDRRTMRTYMDGHRHDKEEVQQRFDRAIARWKMYPGWSIYLLFQNTSKPGDVAGDDEEGAWEFRGQVMLEPSDRWDPENGIERHRRQPTEGELSYALVAQQRLGGCSVEFWKQGLGTAAVHALLTHIVPILCQESPINKHPVTSIFATTKPDNFASRCVLYRNNFVPKLTRTKFGDPREWWELSLTGKPLDPVTEGYWEEDPDLSETVLAELKRLQELQRLAHPPSPPMSSSSEEDTSPRE